MGLPFTSFALLPTSRVTELAMTVECLQNQNLEKDRVNKALTEKLEALVRCNGP